jgi:glycine hydroxymethyltransferase
MVVLDLRDFDAELTGKEAQEVLDRAGITTNRNTIPDDPRSPSSRRACAWAAPPRRRPG